MNSLLDLTVLLPEFCPSTRELAVTPVLLNLICAVFRDEQGKLPKKKTDFYEKAIQQLLERLKRNPASEELYNRKEEFLSDLALELFEKNDYFPETKTLNEFARKYFEGKSYNHKKIFKGFESETGILIERSVGYWSFSHLTFQEYFAAKAILCRSKFIDIETIDTNFLQNITKENWKEVFYMIFEMLYKPDELLIDIKKFIDSLLGDDSKLQEFLVWLNEKSKSIKTSHKQNAVRAIYLARFFHTRSVYGESDIGLFNVFRELATSLDPNISDSDNIDLTIDRLSHYLLKDVTYKDGLHPTLNRISTLESYLVKVYSKASYPDMSLLSRIRSLKIHQHRGYKFLDALHNAISSERNIGLKWNFSSKQSQLLQQYYMANNILIYCLKSQCNVTALVRTEIEETLLLPIVEIEKYKRSQGI